MGKGFAEREELWEMAYQSDLTKDEYAKDHKLLGYLETARFHANPYQQIITRVS